MTQNFGHRAKEETFAADVNNSPFFQKDPLNFINIMGQDQLSTLENTSLLDIFLSSGHIVEPHYHQNAAELVYCIAGAAAISILNPNTKRMMNYNVTPGQVVNIPRGWWHYEIATANHTHLLAIFDAPKPEVILGSDILAITPADAMAYTYGVSEHQWKQATTNVKPSTYIGPTTSGHH